MATWAQVRKYALALPGTTEENKRGTPAWLVHGKFFVWERPLNKSDIKKFVGVPPAGAILGVRTGDFELKELLLKRDPQVYFTIAHFEGYSAVLVRLPKIKAKELKEVITEAWLAVAPARAVEAFLKR